MQEILRHYGKYIIAATSFMLVMGILVSTVIFPQYGLLSFLGKKSQVEADHIDGDYMVSTDTSGNDVVLFENQDITFEFMSTPIVGEEFHINFNKGKVNWPETSLIKTNKDNASLKVVSVKNNNDEDALTTLASNSEGNVTNKYQVVYNSYNYTNETDSKDNYINDDGTIIFNEPGVYSVTINAKWENSEEGGYSERSKIFKIHVFSGNENVFTGHKYTGYIVDLEPTCTQEGKKSLHCLIEGHEDERFEEEVIPALGHDWNTTPTIQWAADGKSGVAVYHCNRDASHTRSINFTASGKTKSGASCTQNGVTTYTANIYDEITDSNYTCSIDKNDISPLGHSFTREAANTQFLKSAATCTVPQTYYKSCSRCGISSKGINNSCFNNNVYAKHRVVAYGWHWTEGDKFLVGYGSSGDPIMSYRNYSYNDWTGSKFLSTSPFIFPQTFDKSFYNNCLSVQNNFKSGEYEFKYSGKHIIDMSIFVNACECINCHTWNESCNCDFGDSYSGYFYDPDSSNHFSSRNGYQLTYKYNKGLTTNNNINSLRSGKNRTLNKPIDGFHIYYMYKVVANSLRSNFNRTDFTYEPRKITINYKNAIEYSPNNYPQDLAKDVFGNNYIWN